jgi:hypothetical protein
MNKPYLLKACPRCHGDLRHEVDEFGDSDYVCLQCGRAAPMAMVFARERARQILVVQARENGQRVAS